ncbi:hypothetical protein GA0115240_14915 [Streptomyces sp. DvalAA-14]|nr:hypothetical protein GA0115240_14915 [Streptomyces sp. DvalAA-14]
MARAAVRSEPDAAVVSMCRPPAESASVPARPTRDPRRRSAPPVGRPGRWSRDGGAPPTRKEAFHPVSTPPQQCPGRPDRGRPGSEVPRCGPSRAADGEPPGAYAARPQLVRGRHGHRHRRQRGCHLAAQLRRPADRRHGGLAGRRAAARRPGCLLPPAAGAAAARRRSGAGPVLRRAGGGAAHRGRRGAAPGPAGHRRRGGAGRGLGAVVARYRARSCHSLRGAVPDGHPAPLHRGRGVRRLADAGGAAPGLGGDRRAARPARAGRSAAPGPAAGLLRDARPRCGGGAAGAGHALQPHGAPRRAGRRGRAHGVDRPRGRSARR